MLRALVRAALLLLHVYPSALFGRSLAALVTPRPRASESRETFAGAPMRVSWWRPGWGGAHPAILLVGGATPLGNDFPQLRMLAEGVARAGYLVMLPELPCLTQDRLDPAVVDEIDGAFATLLAHPARRRPTGAFGFSVGGGLLLAAAGGGEALRRADWLGVLGAYFDIDTYLASAASGRQRRGGGLVPWAATEDALTRIPQALRGAARDDAERAAVERALAAREHDEALRLARAAPPALRAAFEKLSPRTHWERIAAPVFWLHDLEDGYVPAAELEAALAAPRAAPLRAHVPRLLRHADPFGEAALRAGLPFWARELSRLLAFAAAVLRAAS